jgi:hypothetical protein
MHLPSPWSRSNGKPIESENGIAASLFCGRDAGRDL